MELWYGDYLSWSCDWGLEDLCLLAVSGSCAVEVLNFLSIVGHAIDGLEDVWWSRVRCGSGGWHCEDHWEEEEGCYPYHVVGRLAHI